ncbi:YvrJ family protein [Lysinibacillus endophyticus]|uniref:YvrJ family protein n=1 Tax=Ureibacillus endophyticus TaxID=1978490 RepID=A0A494YXN4_9BACL|nr:YvrJ family protein [Lysinibacillus endophyticus]MCP1144951.1 YvrJ family protein [Lysinibacillus endophyticus]RKQ14454.1 YvrJ family protein [Lysinibacillus endophyticus]
MEEWVMLLQEIGFPMVVSFYLLHRIESKLEAIHTALVSIGER